ncbi:DNA polymerase III subunit alpha [Aequorivita aquimaris]|uniref:DNA polymerase III subunit alpha n=1 Tax=Aequorivita aquimaris TaxID=1548749 RepID=A0A137RM45_9FLAO|nr:DNA polymerase III subunit alpha [Aequorivita aquimaris]KXO01231.1 DNA polymerase III subunit alpha [Aequorivita aquimaris]
MYINCHTYYSLRYGVLSVPQLLELAKKYTIKSVAITDINSTSACLEFSREAAKEKLKPVVGADIRNGNNRCYVCLAKNNKGYLEINQFLSTHLHTKKDFPEIPPSFLNVITIFPFEKVLEYELESFAPDWYIGIAVNDLNKLKFSHLKQYTEKLVLLQPVTFCSQTHINIHRLLRCIDLNIVLSKLPEAEQGTANDKMYSLTKLKDLFEDFEHILSNTQALLNSCSIDFKFDDIRENQNQTTYLSNAQDDYGYLVSLVKQNIPSRYKTVNSKITERIEKELNAIRQMDFVSYFLINYDIVQYAIKNNYPYIGRGSGANSVVAYILGITNVDPIELDLYFERFINLYRSSPPDFDIDFSWKDRDDVTRYIFERFPNTALMGTYVTFQFKAVVRELAKVFGLPKAEIDAFLNGNRENKKNDHYFKLVIKYSHLIHGFPNYLSVHSGGIVITKNPVQAYCGTFMPPKGFQTLQIDMHIAEAVGIFKFDILAQRGLSKIKDAIQLIRENQPNAHIKNIDDTTSFKNDPAINNLLKVGDCMGVFYVESPAMRTLMTRLQTQDYLGLVAASSIIRPGVTNGGMKNAYIERHRFPEKKAEAHPVLLKIMPDTYGVMVYQEDVLKVAHYFAGLSLAEADVLRRGMSGKGRSKEQFDALERKFYENCKEKGYTQKVIAEVWDQIKAFAGYAFAKGHSASYAVESYQSLYLKKYFPLEFMTAVLNNGGGFYNLDTYINEIFKCGGVVENPCINNSDHSNYIKDKTVFLGFGMIKDLEHRSIQKILTERQLFGPFNSFDDFLDRCKLGLEQLLLLIRLKAFRTFESNKHKLMWLAHLNTHAIKNLNNQPQLFKPKRVNYSLPSLKSEQIIDAYDNLELLGFTLHNDFNLIKPGKYPITIASDLSTYEGKEITILGKLVTSKTTKTSKGDYMAFSTFLDKDGKCFDTVQFPKIMVKYPLTGIGIYFIKGTVTEDLGYYAITTTQLLKVPRLPDPRFSEEQKTHKSIV